MKKLMVALLLLVATSSIAAAQAEPFIGIYADDVAVICQANVTIYVSVPVYLFAILPPEIPAITACEFRIDNMPTAGMGLATYAWNTPLVIGTADFGIALAFSPALPGPNAFLGRIDFLPLMAWPNDWRMTIMPSLDSGNLVVVDTNFNVIPCEDVPHFFTFNCTGSLPDGCECQPIIATEDATWGQIKASYN
jgi:hypothetical protein